MSDYNAPHALFVLSFVSSFLSLPNYCYQYGNLSGRFHQQLFHAMYSICIYIASKFMHYME